MSNYWINVDNMNIYDEKHAINSFYQNIKLTRFDRQDLEKIRHYEWTDFLKSLKLRITGEELIMSFSILQSALFNCDNLQEISIYFRFETSSDQNYRIEKPEFPSLRNLSIENASNAGNVS